MPPPPPIAHTAGLFVLSLVAAAEGRHVLSALLFAALLNAKHIFLYAAPPFFVYLLRRHCRGPPLAAAVGRFLGLGAAVVGVTAASLGPFVAAGQLAQLAGRLFPFARGLCHAYWAPNVWALYAGVDKVLALALGRRGAGGGATMTGTEFEKAGGCCAPQRCVLLFSCPSTVCLRPTRAVLLCAVLLQAAWWVSRSLLYCRRWAAAPPRCGRWRQWRPAWPTSGERLARWLVMLQ